VRLETPRLILSPHTREDFDDMAALWADPAVAGQIGRAVSSRRESWMRLLHFAGLWPLLGYGYWAARERGSGRFVGDLGFADFHRDIEPPIHGVPEAGWVLATWAHGQGYAAEAMTAALAWLDARTDRSVCLIGPENGRSLRLAGRLGYVSAIATRLGGSDALLLTRGAGTAAEGAVTMPRAR
jgi:RimJ/RimL family protein N-acetyltransferase